MADDVCQRDRKQEIDRINGEGNDYAILGVRRDATGDDLEHAIKQVRKTLVLRVHPDKVQGDSMKADAGRAFKKVMDACVRLEQLSKSQKNMVPAAYVHLSKKNHPTDFKPGKILMLLL